MLIKRLNIISEILFYLLLFAIVFSNAFVEICIGFLIFFFLLKRIVLRDPRPPNTPITGILIAFCAVIFVSFLRSAYFYESIRGFAKIFKYAFLYFAILDLLKNDKARIRRVFWVFLAVSLFSYINGIFQGVFGFDFMRHRQLIKDDYLRRISAGFVHPNDFAAYIITVLPLSFMFLLPQRKRWQRLLLIAISLLGFYCLLRTSSRGAWFGFLVGLAVFIFYYNRKLLLLLPLVFLLIMAVSPDGFRRVALVFSNEQSTGWERMQLWKGTWAMIKERPVLGFGINTFSRNFPKYKPADYPDLRYAHNCYLQMWSEIGLIGLGVFLSLIGSLAFSVIKNLKRKARMGFEGVFLLALFSGYIGFLVHAALDTNLYSLVLYCLFWVVCACLVSLNALLNDGLRQPDRQS